MDVPYMITWARYFTIQLNITLSDDEKQLIFGEIRYNCHTTMTSSTMVERCKNLLNTPTGNSSFHEKVTLIKAILDSAVIHKCMLAMVIDSPGGNMATELLFACCSDNLAYEFMRTAKAYVIQNTQLPINPGDY